MHVFGTSCVAHPGVPLCRYPYVVQFAICGVRKQDDYINKKELPKKKKKEYVEKRSSLFWDVTQR